MKYAIFNEDGTLSHTVETEGKKPKGSIVVTTTDKFNTLKDGEMVWIEPVVPIEEAIADKISKLHAKYKREYDEYLSKYCSMEIVSFATKQKEAEAYEADNTAPTPRLSAMVGGDEDKRIELITSILDKLDYLAQREGVMVATRDAIKACTTIEELEEIEL